MKGKFKKIVCGVAAMSLVAAFGLAGCSSSGGGSSASSSASASSSSAATAEGVTLQVFAANSLSKAMPEAMDAYRAEKPEISFADAQYLASGDLNAELEGGAYSDVEITASKKTMDEAVEKKLVDESTRVDMFTNELVIIAKKGSDIKGVTLKDIADGKYTVCIGDENVPAGNYARQALSTVGLYKATGADEGKEGAEISGSEGDYADGFKPHLVAKVGDVCSTVSTGDVQVGFVYTSDVYRFDDVEIVGTVPNDTHKAIVYPGAVCKVSEHADEAKAFIDWCITSDDARAIWQKWGFELA